MEQKTKFSSSDRLLDVKEVMDIVRMSKTRLYELMKLDQFPRPIKVGRMRVAWIETEIISFINERIEERDRRL